MLRLLNYKLFSVVLAAAVLWLGISAFDVGVQRRRVQGEARDLAGRLQALEKENQFLSRSGEYFKSELFLERQARLKLNYKLPGEQVVFVYDAVASSQPHTFSDELAVMENYKKWWYFLVGF
jgi:cell division protein FtsB